MSIIFIDTLIHIYMSEMEKYRNLSLDSREHRNVVI